MGYQIRSYVTRPGRITRLQRLSLEQLADRYCIAFRDGELDLHALFPTAKRIVMEIGFGMGVATAELAEANPDVGYLGIEVFRAGVGKLLSEIERRELANVRIIAHDAVEVCRQMVPPNGLDGVHLFFPDPWPKKRHHKRRLVQPPFAELVTSRLAPGGYIYAVTDWEDYADQILQVLGAQDGLRNGYSGFATPLEWRPQTKFERKGLAASHIIKEIYFTKV